MAEKSHNWSNLVGKDGNEAVEVIKRESGLTSVHVIPEGSMVTMDYRTDRIRVYVDKNGKVTRPPALG